VLILDEPTDGLDPNQKHEVRALIQEWRRQDHHHLDPHPRGGHAVCTRAIIIARGRIVADDTPHGAGGALALPQCGASMCAHSADAGAVTR
jgi:ABC-2 type transport system ATP-binding protein